MTHLRGSRRDSHQGKDPRSRESGFAASARGLGGRALSGRLHPEERPGGPTRCGDRLKDARPGA